MAKKINRIKVVLVEIRSHKQMACGATWQECHYGVKMVYQRQPAQSGDVAFDSATAERGSAGLDSQGC